MTTQPLVALDIGSTKIACAIGLPHEHAPGFELLGTSLVSYPSLPEAWLSDPLMVSRTIEQAVEATSVHDEFHRALVAISHPTLASEQTRALIALGDEPMTVRAQDLDRLQTAALHQVLGVDREPLMVERLGYAGNGFEGVRDPRGLSATRLAGTFHIVTMPLAVHHAVVQVVEASGLEVARLVYTLPAAWASATDEATSQKRLLLIDAGGLSTDLGIFRAGVFETVGVVPSGGVQLAGAIAKSLQVTMDQALAWSLEGTSCRKPAARSLITQHWETIQQALDVLLAGQPKPDAAILSGRGALTDGFAERIERTTGVPTSLCRSPRTSAIGDLARQLGLSPVIGLLEMATQRTNGVAARSPHFFNRLIDRTRTILTEYF